MQYKVVKSFANVNFTAKMNTIITINNKQVADDLLKCGYIIPVEQPKKARAKQTKKKVVD